MDSQSKKRKRHKGDVSHKSAKKPAVSFAKDEVHVSLVDGAKDYPPVLAVPVGLSAPSIPLRAYTQAKKSAAPSRQDREIVLHSSEHPRLDYFATEEFGNSSEKLLKHYIAIYDPESAQMKLVQVRRVALRSTLRQTQAELDEAANPEYKSNYERRRTLGMEFGNKRTKRRITQQEENAVITAGDGEKMSKASRHLIEAIGESVAAMPSAEQIAEAAESSKPKPRANIHAKLPKDVYPLDALLDPSARESIPVDDWLQACKKKEPVKTFCRFVSRRILSAAQNNDLTKLKVLRYLEIMYRFFISLKDMGRGKRLPPRFELEQIQPFPVTAAIRKRFSKSGEMTNFEVDYLITHFIALALHIDSFSLSITDLKDEFRMELAKFSLYFRELGCKVVAPNPKEKVALQLAPTDRSHKIGRLVCPPDFPEEKVGSRRRR